MKGTQDELQFGDQIQVDLTKEEKGKTVHKHFDCKFIPELVDMFLDAGIIEVEDDGEENNDYDTSSWLEEALDSLTNILTILNNNMIEATESLRAFTDTLQKKSDERGK